MPVSMKHTNTLKENTLKVILLTNTEILIVNTDSLRTGETLWAGFFCLLLVEQRGGIGVYDA